MDYPSFVTTDFSVGDPKHPSIKINKDQYEQSETPLGGPQTELPNRELKKKHMVQWEGKSQTLDENNSTDAEPCTVNTAVLIMNDMSKESISSETKGSLQTIDCIEESSEKFVDPVEHFPTDISLQLVMVKRKSGLPDPRLQGKLRARLRLLENDSKEVMAVFGELSARLLSIHSDQDLIIVTFKTFEEIWKFSTYYSLGFLNHCMENMLLDQSFWLSSVEDSEEEEVGVEVCISDGYLNLMYRGLLMQEGTFFVHCPDKQIREATVVDSELKIHQNSEDTQEPAPINQTLHFKASLKPVSPFHQWFLKTHSLASHVDVFSGSHCQVSNQIAMGSCVALVDYESDVPEEISFKNGERIEIVGFFIECMPWFVGQHTDTGKTGFVKSSHVKPDIRENDPANKEFLHEEEKIFFREEAIYDYEKARLLLKQLSETDVCTVYKLDTVEDKDSKAAEELDVQTPSNCNPVIRKATMKETSWKSLHGEIHSKITEIQVEDNPKWSVDKVGSSGKETEMTCFCINQEFNSGPDSLQSLLLFLNYKAYQPCFKDLYDISCSFLKNIFHGYSEEEDVVRYLSTVREAAKKASMNWALIRVCFLLGRICRKKHKFSQARVYFEEALGVIRGEFSDIFLVVALYTNLTEIYLKQSNREKYLPIFDKVASLLMVIPNCICSSKMESVLLKYALKNAVLSQDQHSEARACFLLVKLYTHLKQYEEALPFLERLQALNSSLHSNCMILSLNCYFRLSDVYTHKCLPHLALSCVKAASQRSTMFMGYMKSVECILKNASKLYGLKKTGQIYPTQIAPYLRRALSLVSTEEEKKLASILCASLSELYAWHKEHKKAIICMRKAFDTVAFSDPKEVRNSLVSLGWLYILDGQNNIALDIFNDILECENSTCQQSGVIYNLSAIALRKNNETKQAAVHYYKARHISEEMGERSNQAIVLANFGILCLHVHAYSLAELYLIKSTMLFCRLQDKKSSIDFIQVLLLLGHYYINGSFKEKGRIYYEWALLVAMEANNFEKQLQALQLLCQFCRTIAVDEAQCIIYNKYQLSLVRKMSDKVFESQILETISHLYLSLGTERAYRSALEYTKRSLGIFIDLQQKDKEAFGWLQAGKIYHVLGQRELVDLYIQVAQEAALCTGDPRIAMELFEGAGDIYANGTREREKAVPFYRDRALPLIVKTGNRRAELKLCNKLVELLLHLKAYDECLDYAKASLSLSITVGNQLNERIAYHRLAGIYHHLGQCELAEHYYLKALSLCPSPLEFDEEAVYYMKVYLILGDITFYDLKDPFDAAGYYHLALAAAMDVGNKKAQLKIYTKLAIIYHNFLVDREMSLFFYKKARIFASELNVRRINLSADQRYQSTAWTDANNLM
ncbi:SH3 domain and tetratricopeptide repeat-containing protein 1 isoform X1 [Pleurodeles waltl]|uniref:SH3 domain and tetratricopeptide repeat-containing protein 1 isoform X1 n=1 Tax=Pleurodeles waltl TaxID=8319 RepID=UPI003709A5A0